MLKRRLILAAFILLLICRSAFSQKEFRPSVRIMFYNVENAFDVFDDKKTEDEEFLPEGIRRWTHSRYEKKINNIYKTIISAGNWNPPEIVAFCEIENRKVLEDLIYGTWLSKFRYRIIHEDSPDRRGIDVCLIFRDDSIDITEFKYWKPQINGDQFTSRNVLYCKVVSCSDTIHLFVNHWPSRRGGVLAGEETRIKVAGLVKMKADSINVSQGGHAKIIIIGDFNSTPEDNEIKVVTSSGYLVNLSEMVANEFPGTYKYQGRWETIDQVIASESLMNSKERYYVDQNSVRVFSPDYLLVKDPAYPGNMPLSTYRGYRYQGGFSDHLPVITDLYFRTPARTK